jgi:predicted O-methyltransferase YrrM
MTSAFQAPCVIGAAAELDVFTKIGAKALTAYEIANKLRADLRGTTALLDALVALEVLIKEGDKYRVPPEILKLLTEKNRENMLSMARHQMNCLRGWAELAKVVKKGVPAKRRASIRGAKRDRAAFLEAMDNISAPAAPVLVGKLLPLSFKHLLDVGGASGTWTAAFLNAVPDSKATLFDLPDAIPHAEKRLSALGLKDRVTLVAGDFYMDTLPAGADLVWLGAIIHQNSRQQNRELFAKCFAACSSGGRILIRDIVMEPGKTAPKGGAMFAINMLVHTPHGGTFTLAEMDEDLRAAGFGPARQIVFDPWMNSVVEAVKP